MQHLGDGIYSQQYYSEDYFILFEVLGYERRRLALLDILVISHEISFKTNDEGLLFFLVLFFKSDMGENLIPREGELFNYKSK